MLKPGVVVFAVGSVVMRSAGCVVNDMWDRDLDRQVTRTAGRPLASGALRLRDAAVFLAVLLATGLVVLLQLPLLAQALGVGSLLLVALYPLAKRVTWWPQVMLGLTFGWGAPMGFAAASGHLTLAAGLLYAAAICWIVGYDTIYAHQDREDDALIGIRSTARLSAAHPRRFVAVFYALATAFLVAAAWVGLGFQVIFVAFVWWYVIPQFRSQVRQLDPADPALCLKLFKSNVRAGIVIALCFGLGLISQSVT